MANAKASSKTKTRTKTLPRTKRPDAVKTQALDKAGEQLERAQAAAVESKQPRFAVTRQQAVNLFNQIYGVAKEAIFNEPPYAADSTRLDTWLAKVVKKEPYLLGILQSVVSIDKNRGWTLVGGKIQVKKFVSILHNFQVAPDLFGWRNGLSVSAQNFYQSNLGAVVEIGRSQPNGPLAALYTVDPTKCRLTGRQEAPLKYNNGPRDKQYWETTDYFRVTSFPSPMETMNGLGMCAVYRCIELAKLLVSVFEHDREQLGSKAPKGILTINGGITLGQWLQSLEESPADLKSLEREYYSGVQVLVGDLGSEVKVNLTPLSNLPEQFDHRQFADMIIYGYALAFGYDPREFWPVSSGALGTATESESQHRKASSKGGLDFVLGFQERLQDELPETVEFEFEQRDVQGDIAEADFKKKQLDIIEDMFTKSNSKQENAITLPEARQLLVEARLIPDDWTPGDEDVQVEDTEDLGALVEKQRVQRAIAKFPNEQIVVYNDRTKQTHVIYDPNNRKFTMRVAKPAVVETPAPVVQPVPVVDMTPVLDAINERFAELKRETPAPAAPVIVQQAESPSWLESVVARLTNPTAAGIESKSFDAMVRSVSDLATHVKGLQGVNEKYSERDLRSVADALNHLALRSTQQTPAPDVNITMSPITLHAQMPKGNDPVVNFNPTIRPSDVVIRENTPVNVTVQPAAAPVNNITVKPADVKVDIPKPVREMQKINRGKNQNIESTETEIEYEK